ncbi:MAG: GNAT family N-acetyltransferase [Sphingobacteriia bacterium]|nr:GNAT family N-acetyltransferase [Sphingobacteriia bacterium]
MKKTYKFNKLSNAEAHFELTESNELHVLIRTDNLYLEPVKEEDITPYHEKLFGNSTVMKSFVTGITQELSEVQNTVKIWVERWKNNNPFSSLTVTRIDDDKFVGQVNLGPGIKDKIPGTAEISYTVNPEVAGCGFGSEAVRAVFDYAEKLSEMKFEVNGGGFREIIATALPNNYKSIKILENCGMKFEKEINAHGSIRNFYRKNFTVASIANK